MLIDYIRQKMLCYLAIIGLAKNSGKTVTFNQIVKEATKKGLSLVLLSYGRDGEELDSITRQKKPRIYIPPNSFFVTTSKALAKSNLRTTLFKKTGWKTLLGEVSIYQTKAWGGYVELVGVNTISHLERIKEFIPRGIDLMMIDGALDRRSSAMPALTEGFVLATGAVVGNTVELVVSRTMAGIEKLSLPQITNPILIKYAQQLFTKGQGGIVNEDDQLIPLSSALSFGSIKEIRDKWSNDSKALILNGALVDSFIEGLVYSLKIKDCMLIVKDGTRVFLNKRNLNLLNRFKIKLQVLNSLELLAVTVNPVSPSGVHLDSDKLVSKMRESLKGVPVYDLLGEEYQLMKRGESIAGKTKD